MNETQARETPGIEFISHYLKDLSFEAPSGPCPPERLGEVDLKRDLRVNVDVHADGTHQVSLSMFATGTLDGRTLLLCELTYTASVRLHLIPEPVRAQTLSADVPAALLPHVKRVLENNSVFAGFPPLRLTDIDFMQMYREAEASGQLGGIARTGA